MGNILCLDIRQIDEEIYKKLYSASSMERQKKADRYKNREDKIRCISAYSLLSYVLGGNVELCENEYGKPFVKETNIKENKAFHFNVSHSGDLVVLGYGEKPLGVDVERIRKDENVKKIALRCFTQDELEYLSQSETLYFERFAEIWTGKESYLKYLGTGIAGGLKSANVIKLKGKGLFSQKLFDDYYLSYFFEDANVSLSFVTVDMLL